jgi:hypothetical protein
MTAIIGDPYSSRNQIPDEAVAAWRAVRGRKEGQASKREVVRGAATQGNLATLQTWQTCFFHRRNWHPSMPLRRKPSLPPVEKGGKVGNLDIRDRGNPPFAR